MLIFFDYRYIVFQTNSLDRLIDTSKHRIFLNLLFWFSFFFVTFVPIHINYVTTYNKSTIILFICFFFVIGYFFVVTFSCIFMVLVFIHSSHYIAMRTLSRVFLQSYIGFHSMRFPINCNLIKSFKCFFFVCLFEWICVTYLCL